MTEQEKHVNHFLTLYIGECWHEPKIPVIKIRTLTCSLCGYEKELFDNKQWHFDFYTPNDFFHLRKWMEKNEAELWSRYLRTIYRDTILHSALLNSLPILFREWLNPSNLFEFLIENRKSWKNIWVCSNCGYTDKIEKEVKCWKCGKGEMLYQQHPAAQYLDSIEGKP